MAFLLRAGRHAVGPVWPLPAVPAAWYQAEPLIKQPPSAWVPTEPGPRPRSLRRGHQVGFGRRVRPSRGRQERALDLESKPCPSRLPTRGTAARGSPPPPAEGLSFPMWQPEVAGARTRGSTGSVGPEPGLGRGVGGCLAGGPCSHQTVSKSAVAAAVERQGPATPTGPGMRKELRECHGPGAQTVLISWLRFNPSPGLPGPPSTSSEGPCPRLRAHTAWPSLGHPLTLSPRLHL